jgi:hypothetical protein
MLTSSVCVSSLVRRAPVSQTQRTKDDENPSIIEWIIAKNDESLHIRQHRLPRSPRFVVVAVVEMATRRLLARFFWVGVSKTTSMNVAERRRYNEAIVRVYYSKTVGQRSKAPRSGENHKFVVSIKVPKVMCSSPAQGPFWHIVQSATHQWWIGCYMRTVSPIRLIFFASTW